jgi:hypothetical protein
MFENVSDSARYAMPSPITKNRAIAPPTFSSAVLRFDDPPRRAEDETHHTESLLDVADHLVGPLACHGPTKDEAEAERRPDGDDAGRV